LRELWKQKYRI